MDTIIFQSSFSQCATPPIEKLQQFLLVFTSITWRFRSIIAMFLARYNAARHKSTSKYCSKPIRNVYSSKAWVETGTFLSSKPTIFLKRYWAENSLFRCVCIKFEKYNKVKKWIFESLRVVWEIRKNGVTFLSLQSLYETFEDLRREIGRGPALVRIIIKRDTKVLQLKSSKYAQLWD